MSSPIQPVKTTTTPSAPKAAADESVTNFSASANSFSGLVQQAAQTPETRSDLINSFKTRIASGQYPTAQTIDDLVDAIGGSILKMAGSE